MLLLVELVPFVVNVLLMHRIAGISLGRLWTAALRPMPAAIGMGVVMLGVAHLTAALPAPVTLVAAVAAGLLTYVLGLWCSAPELFEAGLKVVRSVRGRLPGGSQTEESASGQAEIEGSDQAEIEGSDQSADNENAPVGPRTTAPRTTATTTALVMLGLSPVVALVYSLRNGFPTSAGRDTGGPASRIGGPR